jgi:putative flippase GtrA
MTISSTLLEQIGRFSIVSVACSLLNIIILILGDWFHLHYVLSVVISFAICVVIGYFAHSRVSYSVDISRDGFGRYCFAMALNIPVSISAVFIFHDVGKLPMSLAAILATGTTVIYNFAASRWAIAHAPHSAPDSSMEHL